MKWRAFWVDVTKALILQQWQTVEPALTRRPGAR